LDEVLIFQIPFSRRCLWLESEEAPVAREGVPPRRRDLPLRQVVAAVQECTLSGQKKKSLMG